ncbi:5939_t:CDS:2, partial [Ambispora leptoticha]
MSSRKHKFNEKGTGGGNNNLTSDLLNNDIEYEYSVEKEEWYSLLFEQMAYDEGDQFSTEYFFEQWETGEAYSNHHDGLHRMTEDEYAAYMRQGMYEKQNAQKLKEERE